MAACRSAMQLAAVLGLLALMVAAPAAAQYGYSGYGYYGGGYGGSYTGRRLFSVDPALDAAFHSRPQHAEEAALGRAGRSLLQTYGSAPSGYYYYGYAPAGAPAYGRRRLLQATPPSYGSSGYGYYGYGYGY